MTYFANDRLLIVLREAVDPTTGVYQHYPVAETELRYGAPTPPFEQSCTSTSQAVIEGHGATMLRLGKCKHVCEVPYPVSSSHLHCTQLVLYTHTYNIELVHITSEAHQGTHCTIRCATVQIRKM